MEKFTLYLIYHSHIDIGYTERQERIARYHADFTHQAVQAVLSNKEFKYTAEGFWSIEHYLNKYGREGEALLLEAIKTNRFELTPAYAHLAELINEDNIRTSLSYAKAFQIKHQLPEMTSAMACDINGFSYAYAEALHEVGVRYLYTNINTHHGGAPFMKPLVPFYWETHKGNKILVWNGLTYHKGNLLGLIPGLTPKGDPFVPGLEPTENGFIDVRDPDDFAKERIYNMIKGFKKMGYAYNFAPISASGLYTDNSPISDGHVSLINEWNARYGHEIDIKICTLNEFFTDLEKIQDIPTYRGDWNDWWTDGVLSTPDETRLFKHAQRTQKLIKRLDVHQQFVHTPKFSDLTKNLILYSEHTWGHSASWSDPYKLIVKQLDLRKAKLAIDADILAQDILDDLSSVMGEGSFTHNKPFKYRIINPHAHSVSTICYLPTDFWEEGHFSQGHFLICDQQGHNYVWQRTYTLRGAFIAIEVQLASNETRDFYIDFNVKQDTSFNSLAEGVFIGSYYRVQFNHQGLESISYDNHEMLKDDITKLGFPVYQIFKHGKRQDAAGFGYGKRDIPKHELFIPTDITLNIKEDGLLFTILRYDMMIQGAKKAATEIKLFKHLPNIQVSVEVAKDLEIDPEGMYICLPFNTEHKKWLLDKPGTLLYPGDQLPMTCTDYYPVDRGVILEGKDHSVAINIYDSPLVTFDRIKLWEFTTTIENKGSLFVWMLNNKWETNFRTDCAGYLESRMTISFNNDLDQAINELDIQELGVHVIRTL